MKKVIVTGGKGHVGRPLVARLLRRGYSVKVIDRGPEEGIDEAAYADCDVNDYAALRQEVCGYEAILHLAAIPQPAGSAGPEMFRINCAGTYNIFEAAAEEGIRRVVCASSINALGYHYGCKEFPIQYFPIDEGHPTFTTDPYSFSKQVTEDIAAYYWRREGISSVCLRLPGVFDASGEAQARMKEWLPRTKKAMQELLVLPENEREQRIEQLAQTSLGLRAQRYLEMSYEVRQRMGLDFSNPDVRLITGRTNFWAIIDAEDSAQAFEKAMLADYEGSHPLFVNDEVSTAGVDSEALLALFFPEVKARKHQLQGMESLVSIEKARQLIGFEPEFSLRRHWQ